MNELQKALNTLEVGYLEGKVNRETIEKARAQADELMKGKSFPIGTIHNGFKKIAEGKWRKVSEHGMTKEEHEREANKKFSVLEPGHIRETYNKIENKKVNEEAASKLDTKEYSDVDVIGKEEKPIKGKNLIGEMLTTKTGSFKIVNISQEKEGGQYKIDMDNGKSRYTNDYVLDKLLAGEEHRVPGSPYHLSDEGDFIKIEGKGVKKSISPDIQKAITTLEIGHLLNQVSADTLEKARGHVTPLGTVVRRADGKDWKKTSNGWEPVKLHKVGKVTEGVDSTVGITNKQGATNIKDISIHNADGSKKENRQYDSDFSKIVNDVKFRMEVLSNLDPKSRAEINRNIERYNRIQEDRKKYIGKTYGNKKYQEEDDKLRQVAKNIREDSEKILEGRMKSALDQPDMNEGTKEKMFGKEKEGTGGESNAMNLINSQLEGMKIRDEEKIKKMNFNRQKLEEYSEKVKKIVPSFEKAIEKEGFKVNSIFVHKTGTSDDWKEDDYVKVGVRLEPISGKVRFISDQGYTSSGSGRNQKQLNAKAESLENKVKEATGLTSVQVNPFSFEVKNKDEKKTVLLDFWVK